MYFCYMGHHQGYFKDTYPLMVDEPIIAETMDEVKDRFARQVKPFAVVFEGDKQLLFGQGYYEKIVAAFLPFDGWKTFDIPISTWDDVSAIFAINQENP